MTRAVLVVAAVVAGGLVWTDVWPGIRGPAPWPPEWQWVRRTEPTSGDAGLAVVAGAVLIGLVGLAGRYGTRRLIAAGAVAGLAFWLGLLQLEPRGAMRTLARNTLDSSYHRVAVADAGNVRGFLRTHAERLPSWTGRDRHAATHPPGVVVLHRLAFDACRLFPRLTRALLLLRGVDPGGLDAGAAAVHASALLMGLLLAGLAAATVWPIEVLARRAGADPKSALRIALLWPLLPGPAVLAGQVDPALALPITACAAGLASALDQPHGWRAAAQAGLAAGLAVHVSYGAALFSVFAAAAAAALTLPSPGRAVRTALVAGAAALVLVVVVPLAAGHDVIGAARTALAIHREEYTMRRSYGHWLVWNVLDVALFLGAPLFVLLVARVVGDVRAGRRGLDARGSRLALAISALLAALLLSGLVRGETGRIWAPLMPLMLVAALAPPAPLSPREAGGMVSLAVLLGALAFVVRASWHVF